jgi:hypothetical protein
MYGTWYTLGTHSKNNHDYRDSVQVVRGTIYIVRAHAYFSNYLLYVPLQARYLLWYRELLDKKDWKRTYPSQNVRLL